MSTKSTKSSSLPASKSLFYIQLYCEIIIRSSCTDVERRNYQSKLDKLIDEYYSVPAADATESAEVKDVSEVASQEE